MKISTMALAIPMLVSLQGFTQETRDIYPVSNYKPLKIDVTENVYLRFILWHQQWLITNNLEDDSKFQMSSFARRSRVLAYAQISPRFLILTHFGLNNLSSQANLTSLGNNGDGPQFFLHGAWTEFKVSNSDALYVGTGLHYWKGLTRLANASTLNFMTLDQARPFVHWHSLGITDQFARHMGIYAKGQIGKFDYRLAWNNPLNPDRSLGGGANFGGAFTDSEPSDLTYNGRNVTDANEDPVGNSIVEGYFRYNFFDTESTKLPYQVGTYFGNKTIFGIGVGFFSHTNGMYNNATEEHEDLFHFAIDAFYDAPLGSGAISAYASFINFDYGENYVSRWAGTGTNLYTQVGYHLPNLHIMPYVAMQSGYYDALQDNVNSLDFGINYYVNGHNAKITLEYHMERNDFRDSPAEEVGGNNGNISQIRLQTHIFL
ncbi:MAG: porin [Bacteroidota bacterium]